MDILGSVALLLAFLAAVYALVAGIVGIVTRRPLVIKSARNAGMAVFVLVAIAAASLEYLFFSNDFSSAYVAEQVQAKCASKYEATPDGSPVSAPSQPGQTSNGMAARPSGY